MELDELKQAWQTLDRRLQQQHSLQFAELHERTAGKIRSRLRPLFWGQLLQMLFGIAAIVVGVAIWNTMWMLTPALIGGIVVHVYGIATTAVSGLVLQRIVRIDSSLPVLELQQRLAQLRKTYVISGAVAGLPWWLLWMVPPVIAASLQNAQHGTEGLPAWLWMSIAVGVLGLLATWGFHHWLHRPGREALATRMDISAAGASLRKAQAELDALRAYADG